MLRCSLCKRVGQIIVVGVAAAADCKVAYLPCCCCRDAQTARARGLSPEMQRKINDWLEANK